MSESQLPPGLCPRLPLNDFKLFFRVFCSVVYGNRETSSNNVLFDGEDDVFYTNTVRDFGIFGIIPQETRSLFLWVYLSITNSVVAVDARETEAQLYIREYLDVHSREHGYFVSWMSFDPIDLKVTLTQPRSFHQVPVVNQNDSGLVIDFSVPAEILSIMT
jgi:hypothetical protein